MLTLSIFGLILGYSLATLGAGELVIRILKSRIGSNTQITPITKTATSFILGQGILGNIWLLLALGGFFNSSVVTGLSITFALAGIKFLFPRLPSIISQCKKIINDLITESLSWKIIAFFSTGICLLWATSLGRSIAGDGASFYMSLAKVMAATNRLFPLPGFEYFTGIGILGEMHYAALISIGNPDAAQLYSWPIIVSATIILLALGRLVGLGRRGQWIAFAMVFTSTAVLWLSGDGKTDLFATAFGISAYFWILQIDKKHHLIAKKLSGLFLGFSIVAKISYVIVMLPSIALIIYWAGIKKAKEKDCKVGQDDTIAAIGGQVIGWLILALTPHIIKNSLLFQNPFVPFTTENTNWINQVWHQESTIRRIVFTYPLALVFGTYAGQYGNISPLTLAFLPLVLLKPRNSDSYDHRLTQITIAGIIALFFWVLAQPSVLAPRYFLATLLLFTLPTARSAEYFSNRDNTHPLLSLSIIASILFTIIMLIFTFHNLVFFPSTTYRYLSGNLSECGRDPYYCKTLTALNQIAGKGNRILINVRQRYWLRHDLMQCLLTTREIEAFNQLDTAQAQWEYLVDRGFQYIVIFTQPENIHPIVKPNIQEIPEWLRVTSQVVDNNLIIEIESLDPAHKPKVSCKKEQSNIWVLTTP